MARSAIHPGKYLVEVIEASGITADMALRLGRYFGLSAELWMNLQQIYDLRRTE